MREIGQKCQSLIGQDSAGISSVLGAVGSGNRVGGYRCICSGSDYYPVMVITGG